MEDALEYAFSILGLGILQILALDIAYTNSFNLFQASLNELYEKVCRLRGIEREKVCSIS